MPDRLWNLRLNMDLFNGAYMKLRNDSDRLEYFLGWHLGCLDGELSEGDSKPFQAGFEVGHAMIEEAKAFSEKQSLRGQASAESRRASRGTAQPSRTEHRTASEPPFEPPFDVSSNQSTNHKPQSTNEQTKKRQTKSSGFSSEAEQLYLAYPKKAAPDKAKAAIEKALKSHPFDKLMTAVTLYAESRKGEDPTFTKMPQGWFNDCRFLDDPSTWLKSQPRTLKNGVKHDGFSKTDYLAGLDGLPTF